ncbi:MAG: hypothetical protein ABSG65_24900 [Bryobacteraceae bacterium]|jgi:hypothetical protein
MRMDDLTRRKKEEDILFQELEAKERLAVQSEWADNRADLERKAKVARAPMIKIARMLVKEGKTLTEVHAFLDQELSASR